MNESSRPDPYQTLPTEQRKDAGETQAATVAVTRPSERPTQGLAVAMTQTLAAQPQRIGQPPDEILRQVLDLRLIEDAADWEAARQAVPDPEDAPAILAHLTRMPARWSAELEESLPILTQFQVQQILLGKAGHLCYQHFVILDRVGAGGMGEVFKARHRNLPLILVLKTLTGSGRFGAAQDSELMKRFEREARLLTRLQHPLLPRIYHADFEHGTAFIAMEYVRGPNLQQIVKDVNGRSDKVPIDQAIDWIVQTAQVLGYAHDKGVIHRDIKPNNIIVGPEGIKLLDLGIAGLLLSERSEMDPAEALTQGGKPLGTPAFMAPEQWADARSVQPASDIYSLGCTLFCVLTGKVPFRHSSVFDLMRAHTSTPPPSVRESRPDCPEALDAIVTKMLAKRVEERFASCRELIEALAPLRQPAAISTAPAAASAAPPAPTRASHVPKVVAAVIVLAGLAGVLYMGNAAWQDRPAPSPPTEQPATSPRAAVENRQAIEPIVSPPARPVTKREVDLFEGLHNRLPALEDPLAEFRRKSFLAMYEWLLHATQGPGSGAVRLLVRVNGMMQVVTGDWAAFPVRKGNSVAVQAESDWRGFLSILVLGSDGEQVLLVRRAALEPGTPTLIDLGSAQGGPGKDVLVFFLTEEDPNELWSDERSRPLIAKVEEQGLVALEQTAQDLKVLASAFAEPSAFERILARLQGKGDQLPEASRAGTKKWARRVLEIRLEGP